MPFEAGAGAPKKIAVIGAGVSGMGAAFMLGDGNHVTLFEAETRLGGHARTIMAGKNGDQPVDTGFIVFNYANYPHLAALFDQLHVPVVKSRMSFGASIDGGSLEYGLHSLDALFAQRGNVFKPSFLRMVRDIFRFNANALKTARLHPEATIGEFLEIMGTGSWFRDYYLLPLSGAIWSTPTEKIMDFPAHAMVQFFENHALLHHSGQHQWYTVQGGSVEYVRRLEMALIRKGVELRLGSPVQSVRRSVTGVEIKPWGGDWEHFDEVVFATHSDDSLRMLADPSAQERRALGAIAYQPNDIVLHSDEAIMPRRRNTWASWVYTEDAGAQSDRIDLTYWMNSLQPIPVADPHFVTLNTKRTIREELIYDQVTLRHPVYDLAALSAQDEVRGFNGTNRTWFCGAWMKNGFHEDGLASAVDVAVDHIQGQTFHGRKGAVANAFRYSIDYVMLNAEEVVSTPWLFRRNQRGVCALYDRDHGGAPGEGKGAAWVRDVLRQYQLPSPARIMLLAQPRFWNHVFNPVSFWVCYNQTDEITAVIAEVTNTFGERHSYLVNHPDSRPILPSDRMRASKIFYVSPFQKIEGGYEFRFDINDDRIGIWIDYSDDGQDGLIATLTGKRRDMTNRSILHSLLRRPLGSRRVLALIHWQALKLWWKGGKYRVRPTPPDGEVSRG